MDRSFRLPIDCPNCAKKATLVELQRNIPHFGKALFSTISCEHCGIKFNNVFCLSNQEPTSYSAKIESEEDLKTKIVRCSSSTIKIPALGVTIHPTQLADGYYSNMEGLLERVQEVVEGAQRSADTSGSKQNAERILKKIAKARDGKLRFTVYLEDPLGGSALIGKKAKKLRLSEARLKQLREQMPL